ncbi:hypothetical protein ABZ914_41525 [Spirillospora sp. NPDC046719]
MSEPWTTDRRRPSLAGRLARLGFTDAGRAERLLLEAERDAGAGIGDDLLDALGGTADPDLALNGLLRVLASADERGAGADLRAALRAEPGTRERVAAVLGVSDALGDHLVRHPEHWRVLRDDGAPGEPERPSAGALRTALLEAVGADPAAEAPVASGAGPETLVALRAAYRARLLSLAGRDLIGVADVAEVAAELADLAAAAAGIGPIHFS